MIDAPSSGATVPGYREALAWLYARQRGSAPRDPERMAALLRALELRPPADFVHVVGTNGKGTVTAMIDAGLRAQGTRSGRFVSPHVEDFRERVSLDGRPVSREAVRRFVARARRLSLDPPPAFFEWTLALALAAFERAGLPWAVIEAGVGGARDATRALEPARLVVLTNVALDHLETLGPDVSAIARDKAGAIRAGVPVLTGARGEALAVIRAEAARLGAPLHVDDGRDTLFEVALEPGTAPARAANARLAAGALRSLGVPEKAVAAAVRAAPLPGRGERFRLRGSDVLLDGAHDPAAAALLASSLEPGYLLLFGALPRKQGAATLAALEPGAAAVVLTEATPGEPPLIDLTGRLFVPDPVAALERALALRPPGALVVVAGSLYLAGRIRPTLRRRARLAAAPLPARAAAVGGRS